MENSVQKINVLRKLGTFTATSIVVANMIGTGIFTTSGIMASHLPGSGWIILCWLFGGIIALSGALCYMELSTRMPEEGGEYLYLKKLYHPLLGFLTGWTSLLVGFSAPIAASALSFSEYMFSGLEIQPITGDGMDLIVYKKITAIIIIIVFTLIHYLGVRVGSGTQNVLTALKIIIILGLAGMGMGNGINEFSELRFNIPNHDTGIMGIGVAMMLVMFSYSGWNASAYIAGELKNPRKALPKSLIFGTLIVIVLYVLLNLFIVDAVNFEEMKGVIAVVQLAAVKIYGPWIGDILALLIGIALLSSLSAFILIGPRVYYAMARDRLFFNFASKVHPRHRVPGRSIMIQGFIAISMVIIGTFEQLIIYISFALSIFTWLAVYGIFLTRKTKIGEENAVKVWGYPVTPIFFLVTTFFLMIITYITQPMESTAAILTVCCGIPFYFIWLKITRNKSYSFSVE
ncbi:MAG: amino acid permease [Calditrichaceae bacterium]|nr:amino acid permease [Calditrichaceae bacterium]